MTADDRHRAETQQQIIDFMVDRLGMEPAELEPDAHFRDDLGLDSLDMVELVTVLEEQTGAEVDSTTAERLTTLREVVEYVVSHRATEGTSA